MLKVLNVNVIKVHQIFGQTKINKVIFKVLLLNLRHHSGFPSETIQNKRLDLT